MQDEERDLGNLQRERDKAERAAREVGQKIAAIEEKRRREQEAAEAKRRELAELKSKLASCGNWIKFLQRTISEHKETMLGQLGMICAPTGGGDTLGRNSETIRDLAMRERQLKEFEEFEASLRAAIEAHK
jgi:hypothetical protein